MAKKEYTFDDICADIAAQRYAPVYFLMGEEPFFVDQITNKLIDSVLNENERDFNQIIMYGADVNTVSIINAARRYPMMSKYQLVVVKEAQLIDNIDLLSSYVKNPLQSTILVIDYKYKSLDKRKSLASLVEKVGILFDSKKIPDYKMPGFIVTFLQQRSIEIDTKAAQMLSDFLGNDLSKLNKELDKLSISLSINHTKRITPKLVENSVGISREYNNFELLKAIVIKDSLKCYRIVQYFERNPKNNPIQVTLSVLFNYFSNLLICYYSPNRSEAGIMEALGLHASFQAKDYVSGLHYFSAMKTFLLIGEIRSIDARSKGVINSSTSNSDLLKELLYKILH